MTTTDTAPPTGAELLDAIRAALLRYVVLPSAHAADAVALWIAATHAQPAWAHAPRLVIRAPEKRCGKSRLLDLVEALCHAPLITVNASPAAVYRSITPDPPTLLVDEADTMFGPKADGNEDLRGLLNAGHQRNRDAIRYNAAEQRVEHIPTFAMAALAGIGAMPDTIEDRAVVIHMRRRAPGEKVSPFRHRRDRPPLRQLAGQLTEWLRKDQPLPGSAEPWPLENAQPSMPVEDRTADTWEPLVIVADHAGGDWPDRARKAGLALTKQADGEQPASLGVRLLIDCRTAFGNEPSLPTKVLLERLHADPEAPWAELGNNGLTAMKLGNLLREYDIRSAGNVRFTDGDQAKGYYRAAFTDAWARYCPAQEPARADAGGGAVPAVPAVTPQVSVGRLESVGRLSRPSPTSRPSLTSEYEAGTAGTACPPLRVVGTVQ